MTKEAKLAKGLKVRSLLDKDNNAIGEVESVDYRYEGPRGALADGRVIMGPLVWVRFGVSKLAVPRWANEIELYKEDKNKEKEVCEDD